MTYKFVIIFVDNLKMNLNTFIDSYFKFTFIIVLEKIDNQLNEDNMLQAFSKNTNITAEIANEPMNTHIDNSVIEQNTIIEGCDEEVIHIEVQPSRTNIKKSFCVYYKKLVSKLPRHLLYLHYEETDVKKLNSFPKGNIFKICIMHVA